MLSEISRSQKDTCRVIPLIVGTWSIKFLGTQRRMVVARDWGKGNGELVFNGLRRSSSGDEESCGDGRW